MSILVAAQAVASAACRLVSVLYSLILLVTVHVTLMWAALHLCSKIYNNMAPLYWCMLEYLLPEKTCQLHLCLWVWQQPLHWWPWHFKFTSGCGFSDITHWMNRSKSISWPNFGEIWPRYYYFRFLKTNGRHIWILLPVCNLVIYVVLGWFTL